MYRRNMWHTEPAVWYLYEGFQRTTNGFALEKDFLEAALRLEGDYTVNLNLFTFGKFGRIPKGSKAIGFTSVEAALAFKLIYGERIRKTVIQEKVVPRQITY